MRRDLAVFSGQCVFERGVVATGGLRLEADQVLASFVPAEGGAVRPQSLKNIEAVGQVQIARDDLRGQGDRLNYNYTTRRALLEAGKAPCRMWRIGRGQEFTGRQVEYRMDDKTIRVLEAYGRTKPGDEADT